MKQKLLGLALCLGVLFTALPAHADEDDEEYAQCNLKALANTAQHIENTTDPVRLALLQARYDRLLVPCMPPDEYGHR